MIFWGFKMLSRDLQEVQDTLTSTMAALNVSATISHIKTKTSPPEISSGLGKATRSELSSQPYQRTL